MMDYINVRPNAATWNHTKKRVMKKLKTKNGYAQKKWSGREETVQLGWDL